MLALVAAGHSNGEIAGRLCVSRATAKTHVSNIISKLEVSGRVQAAVVATEAGLGAREAPAAGL